MTTNVRTFELEIDSPRVVTTPNVLDARLPPTRAIRATMRVQCDGQTLVGWDECDVDTGLREFEQESSFGVSYTQMEYWDTGDGWLEVNMSAEAAGVPAQTVPVEETVFEQGVAAASTRHNQWRRLHLT